MVSSKKKQNKTKSFEKKFYHNATLSSKVLQSNMCMCIYLVALQCSCCISNVLIYYLVWSSWMGFHCVISTWSNKPPSKQPLTYFQCRAVFGPKAHLLTPVGVTSSSAHYGVCMLCTYTFNLCLPTGKERDEAPCSVTMNGEHVKWNSEVVLGTVPITHLCHAS